MNKKGTLGTLALIFSIVGLVAAVIHPLFPSASLNLAAGSTFSLKEAIGFLAKAIYIIAYIPTVIISIIAIVKNSNRKGAIIGLILAHLLWIAPIITRLIMNSVGA